MKTFVRFKYKTHDSRSKLLAINNHKYSSGSQSYVHGVSHSLTEKLEDLAYLETERLKDGLARPVFLLSLLFSLFSPPFFLFLPLLCVFFFLSLAPF